MVQINPIQNKRRPIVRVNREENKNKVIRRIRQNRIDNISFNLINTKLENAETINSDTKEEDEQT